MRILAVSDEECGDFYGCYKPGVLDEYDLILSCGDLKPYYLEFLASMAKKPLIYVRGNHDEFLRSHPPKGCECAEDRIVVWNGIRILGLGGSLRYRDGLDMYSEQEMSRRIRKLRREIRQTGGFDILLAHAPARGVNDADDLPHRGFECFTELLDTYGPAYFLHGHIHKDYGSRFVQVSSHGPTTVINACGHYAFDY